MGWFVRPWIIVDADAMDEPFTWRYYEGCLDAALGSGYTFIGFAELTDVSRLPEYPFILLRHDIDYDPEHARPLAELEARRGIQATYFLQADSRFYDVESAGVATMVHDILNRGHWLGLHFDANGIPDDDAVVERVDEVALRLETRFGSRVTAVSFHMPTYRPIGHLTLKCRRVNTYEALFFHAMEYASDSNQDFRGKDVMRILREGSIRRLQLLIHPVWWRQGYTPLATKMEELAEKLGVMLDEILTAEQRVAMGRR
jgi:hypothetical protein